MAGIAPPSGPGGSTVNNSRKRQRVEDSNPRKRVRSQSPKSSHGPRNNGLAQKRKSSSYRLDSHRPGRPRFDSWRHARQSLHGSDPSQSQGKDKTESHEDEETPKRNQKSKRDRKENPSSRIHSLRKLIEYGKLLPSVQAEKERELSALLFEREKKNLKQESKRNLERYHFVRFMERQKAQRTLKQLHKLESSGSKVDKHGRDLQERLKEAEVDLKYTMYAPLGEKYISIFAEQRRGEQVTKAEKYKGNWKLSTPAERKYLDKKQLDTLQEESMEAANVLEIFGNSNSTRTTEAINVKPPAWYEVQAAMQLGDARLEALRDRVRSNKTGELVSGLKLDNAKQEKPGWLNDKGKIDLEDMDSDSVDATAGVKSLSTMRKSDKLGPKNDDGDNDDTSDGDGGFFERR